MTKIRSSPKHRGVLIGLKVLVYDIESAQTIFSDGFYGKPLGVQKPKGTEDVRSPLVLSLIEALYLVEQGKLEVVDTNGNPLGFDRMYSYGVENIPKFELLYKVYKEFRQRGFVLRSALKYGADFAVYERGPGLEHAPYLVHVLKQGQEIDPLEIVRAGRLSHSVRKKFILAITSPSGVSKYLAFEWSKP
ncbi:MAG: tRNA-intron lyase [Thermoproteota archaeon]